jgi:hypothetical protein
LKRRLFFLPERFDTTIKEFDNVEVKRFHQARVRRVNRHELKATYTDWVRDRFSLLIDTRAGTVRLQSPSQEVPPEAAAIHLTRIVYRDAARLLQWAYA